MERTLIVTLLQKSIEELAMMTDGFMEMTEYPAPILRLARRKAEDVLDYLGRLEEVTSYEPRVTSEDAATPPVNEQFPTRYRTRCRDFFRWSE